MPLFLLESAAVTRLLVEERSRSSLVLTLLHVAALALLLPVLAALGGALGAAWAALMAQGTAAILALWLLYDRVNEQAGLSASTSLWSLLPAAALAFGVAYWLPAPWPVQATVGMVVYGAGALLGGALNPAELRRLAQTVGR
jgi:hypothetical protein